MNAHEANRSQAKTNADDDPARQLPSVEESPLIPDAWSLARQGRHNPAKPKPQPLDPREVPAEDSDPSSS